MSEFAMPRAGSAPKAERAARRRAPAEKAVAALAIAAGLCALAAAAALLLPSALRITRYDIRGAATMTRDEVLSAALLRGNERLLSVEPERVRAALEAEPRIAKAWVSRRFPNGLRIDVVERAPVAALLVEEGGAQRLALLDAEGVAFGLAYGRSPSPRAESLPLLSGVRVENFRPGARLPAELASVLRALGGIEASEPALLAAFSEIRVARSRYGETELVLYPLRHRMPVRTGADLTARDLRSIILVLDVLGARGMDSSVSEIDFRTGTVVYRGKEGQSD